MAGGADRFDVLIAGGGFAGSALALALAGGLSGEARVALVDPGPQGGRGAIAQDVRASALSAGSVRLLEALGVWAGLAGVAQPVTAIDITDSGLDAGVRPILLSYDNVLAGGEPATWIVPNAPLLAGLSVAAAAGPGVTIIAGSAVTGMAVTSAGADVVLTDGRTLRASLVVAADGRTSRLRELVGIKTVGWSYPQTGIVTTVAHELPHRGRAVQHFLPAGPFAILPLTGDRSCITWTEAAGAARRILARDDAGFLAEVDRRFGGRLGRIALAGPRQSWPLDMHLARALVADRFALIGDAAHGVHPIAGQGLNLGLRDVAALAEVIADAARVGHDVGHKTVLERYERWRRADAAMSSAAFDGLNRVFSSDAALLRSVRDAGLGIVERLPALQRFLVAEAAGLTGDVPRLLKGERL